MEFLDLSSPPTTVLVVVAHPDDIDFGTAGTVAALTAAGSHVAYGLVTSGEAGEPASIPSADLAVLRQREQRDAALAVGVHDVRFLGHPDGQITPSIELRRDLTRLIRDVRPDLVITQSPERRYDRIYASHPDHLATGEATLAAAYPDARNPRAHPELLDEGFAPHTVPEVWVAGLEPPDVFIDITDVFDRKVKALAAHTSQTARFEIDTLLREWATNISAAHELPDGRLTEAFRRIAMG